MSGADRAGEDRGAQAVSGIGGDGAGSGGRHTNGAGGLRGTAGAGFAADAGGVGRSGGSAGFDGGGLGGPGSGGLGGAENSGGGDGVGSGGKPDRQCLPDWRDTLFVSDLDGTLLRSDKTISQETTAILNRLLSRGVRFTAASARSVAGVEALPLSAVRWNTPLLLMNGALLYDYREKRVLYSCLLSAADTAAVTALCLSHGARPFVDTLENGRQMAQYIGGACANQERFFRERERLFPEMFCRVDAYTPGAQAVYFSMQGDYAPLLEIRQALRSIPAADCVLYLDNYHENNYYLEIFHRDAGKDKGVRRLVRQLGLSRVVAFGDNHNDLPLLRLADTACVVANAAPEIRAAADTVIAGNDEDGVARYLKAVCG